VGLLFFVLFLPGKKVRHSHADKTHVCVDGHPLSFRDPLGLSGEIRITGYVDPIIHGGARADPDRPGMLDAA